MPSIKSFAINTLLIVVSIIVAVVAAELILRVTPLKWKYMYPLNVSGEYFRYDPELGYDIVPNTATSTHDFSDLSYKVWSNNLGCYDAPFTGGQPYIYLAGDSFTWGYTGLDEKWGRELERKLGVRTLNCGVPGFGTRQEAIKANRILGTLPESPKLIVVAQFEDDAGDDFNFPAYTAYHGYVINAWSSCDPTFLTTHSPLLATTTCNVPTPHYTFFQKVKIELAAKSVLYLMAKRQFQIQDKLRGVLAAIAPQWAAKNGITHENQDRFENRAVSETDPLYWDAHFTNLKAFKDLAEQKNSKLLVVFIPFKENVTATSTNPNSANEKTKAYLEKEGIAYLDLLPALRAADPKGERFYWPQDIHWTPAGNTFAGDTINEYIQKENLLSNQ